MEHIFEIAAGMRTSSEFSHNSRARELTFAKCTHIMVSLLQAWKLTVVGIECDDVHFNIIIRACKVTVVGIKCNGAAFLTSFQEGPHQELFFQGIFQTSASKMTN